MFRYETEVNELDIEVAEKVFGNPRPDEKPNFMQASMGQMIGKSPYPGWQAAIVGEEKLEGLGSNMLLDWKADQFSTRIEMAMKVVKHMIESGYSVVEMNHEFPDSWYVSFRLPGPNGGGFATTDSLPKAICLAAVKAMEGLDNKV